jgi:hypothetical protein
MEVKFSLEGEFLAVTMFTGEVKLLKMPAIICPLEDDGGLSNTSVPGTATGGAPPSRDGKSRDNKTNESVMNSKE